jgi:hypothetical protein
MGFGKTFRKAWKNTWGKVEDAIDPVKNTLVSAGIGFAVGGPIGAGIGAIAGMGMDTMTRTQEKQAKAQIASSEKIARMQNSAAAISAAPTPSTATEKASVSAQNEATRKARAFRLSNSVRSSTLGGGFGNKKKTLG